MLAYIMYILKFVRATVLGYLLLFGALLALSAVMCFALECYYEYNNPGHIPSNTTVRILFGSFNAGAVVALAGLLIEKYLPWRYYLMPTWPGRRHKEQQITDPL